MRTVEAQKQRLERIFKESGKGADGDLSGDVSFITRRLEFLEKQSEDRSKQIATGQAPLRKEIAALQQELQEERATRERAISKKNAEVAYFKKELNELLTEIQAAK